MYLAIKTHGTDRADVANDCINTEVQNINITIWASSRNLKLIVAAISTPLFEEAALTVLQSNHLGLLVTQTTYPTTISPCPVTVTDCSSYSNATWIPASVPEERSVSRASGSVTA